MVENDRVGIEQVVIYQIGKDRVGSDPGGN